MSEICKICSQSVRTIYDNQFDINYYYCHHCGFLFMDEKKILSPEEEKKRYLCHTNTLEDSGYVNMLNTFIKKSIRPFHANIQTALDFGSGPGAEPVLAALLRQMGAAVDIYDIYFAPDLVFHNKTYDLITCTEVLEHLKDPLAVLNMLKHHLNPGGILAVMTLFHPVHKEWNGDSSDLPELPGEVEFKDWWYRRDPTHISFFRPETFRYIIKLLDMTMLMTDDRNTISFRR